MSELDQDAAAAQLFQMVQLAELGGDDSSSDESDIDDPAPLRSDPGTAVPGTQNPLSPPFFWGFNVDEDGSVQC